MGHHKSRSSAYYAEWLGDESCELLAMAERESVAPCILARLVLGEHAQAQQANGNGTSNNAAARKRLVSAQLRQPELIENARLRADVRDCVVFDDNYSPLVEKLRHTIGVEYEYRLQARLRNLRIPFLTEADMAARGYPKTPDIKFEVPILIENRFVINWIESKASFGDPETLANALRDQFTAYSNRYGPGLVIYWFGHVKPDAEVENGVLIRAELPPSSSIQVLVEGDD